MILTLILIAATLQIRYFLGVVARTIVVLSVASAMRRIWPTTDNGGFFHKGTDTAQSPRSARQQRWLSQVRRTLEVIAPIQHAIWLVCEPDKNHHLRGCLPPIIVTDANLDPIGITSVDSGNALEDAEHSRHGLGRRPRPARLGQGVQQAWRYAWNGGN